MTVSVVTPAVSLPVTQAEAKLQCRVDGTDEDDLIDDLIAAASDYVEQYTGRAVGEQTLLLSLDSFADEMILPRGPVQSVTSIKYDDANGDEQTLSAAVYVADVGNSRVVLADGESWPELEDAPSVVRITYVAGYDECPASIKRAMLLLIGDWYRGRENTAISNSQIAEMPHAVTALLANYRLFGF